MRIHRADLEEAFLQKVSSTFLLQRENMGNWKAIQKYACRPNSCISSGESKAIYWRQSRFLGWCNLSWMQPKSGFMLLNHNDGFSSGIEAKSFWWKLWKVELSIRETYLRPELESWKFSRLWSWKSVQHHLIPTSDRFITSSLKSSSFVGSILKQQHLNDTHICSYLHWEHVGKEVTVWKINLENNFGK